ncbi:MAG TPA: hypothetical protein PKY82_28280 [Pyrinomonadaceae bacterium]|nr:hypothetical protein [Pyrinomonadaceae bacterium]
MKGILIAFLFVLVFVVFTNAQSVTNSPVTSVTETSPIQKRAFPVGFKSDGCTGFPDGNYYDCCVEHDLDYYYGGSWRERWRSDKRFYGCIKSKGGFKHKVLAQMMWVAVRLLGAPFLPTSFRWGFGKDIEKKAKAQSANNQNLIK